MIKHLFWPDWYFNDITRIPEGFFKKNGIKFLICDIDGTLVPHYQPHPSREALAFLEMTKREGVTVILASNNNKSRVTTFAKGLGLPVIYRTAKPLGRKIYAMMKSMGVHDRTECALIGDQIFTDVLVARRLGISPILVYGAVAKGKSATDIEITERSAAPILKGYVKKYPVNSTERLNQDQAR